MQQKLLILCLSLIPMLSWAQDKFLNDYEIFDLADSLYQAGNYKEVIKQLKGFDYQTSDGITLAAEYTPKILMLRGMALYHLGKYNKAHRVMHDDAMWYLHSSPYADTFYYCLGKVEANISVASPAHLRYEDAFRINPHEIKYYNAFADFLTTNYYYGRDSVAYQAVYDTLTKVIEHQDIANAETYWFRGRATYHKQDSISYLRTLMDFQKTIEMDSSVAKYWVTYANILSRLKRYEEAEGGFEKALVLKPAIFDDYMPYDYIYNLYKLEKYDQALSFLQNELNAYKHHRIRHYYPLTAHILAAQGKHQEAIKYYKKSYKKVGKYSQKKRKEVAIGMMKSYKAIGNEKAAEKILQDFSMEEREEMLGDLD